MVDLTEADVGILLAMALLLICRVMSRLVDVLIAFVRRKENPSKERNP